MQPYNGVAWTRELRDLSNPGKHRHLANLRSTFRTTNVGTTIISPDAETGEQSMAVRYDGEIQVFYVDRRDVLDTLTALHREVEAVVQLFKQHTARPAGPGVSPTPPNPAARPRCPTAQENA
jgi:hypothetical protein